MYPNERVSEGLTQTLFREESALETRGQWYSISIVPSHKNAAFSCRFLILRPDLAREGVSWEKKESQPYSIYPVMQASEADGAGNGEKL